MTMERTTISFLLLLAFHSCVLVLASSNLSARVESTMRFFHVSDFHLDVLNAPEKYSSTSFCRPLEMVQKSLPLEDPQEERVRIETIASYRLNKTSGKYGRYGCDTPESLLHATAQAMARRNLGPEMPRFVLISGDQAAHSSGPTSRDAIVNVRDALAAELPGLPLYFCIGNNDVEVSDYDVACGPSEWLDFLYTAWQDFIPSDQEQNFRQMGAYAVDLPSLSSPLRLVVLNTVLYSARHLPDYKNDPDPCGQLAWLQQELELARANGVSVIILGHILPGMDSYSFVPLMVPSQNAQLIDVIANYSDVITLQVFGHLHHDEYRSFTNTSLSSSTPLPALLVAPSISPIFGNNPEFRVVEMGSANEIVSYQAIWMDLLASNTLGTPVWPQLYDFEEAFHQDGVSAEAMAGLLAEMGEDYSLFSATPILSFLLQLSSLLSKLLITAIPLEWYHYRGVVSTKEFIAPKQGSDKWACLLCTLGSSTQDIFEKCLQDKNVSTCEK